MSALTTLHKAIASTILAEMPQVKTADYFPELEPGIPTPAVLFAITGIDPEASPGDGRTCVRATFEACILVDADRNRAPMQAAILAAQLVHLLSDQYWDLDFVQGTKNAQAMPDQSVPELVQCEAWAVRWQQDVYLGETEWPWEDEPPGSLMFSFSPEVGPGNEGQYFPPASLESPE